MSSIWSHTKKVLVITSKFWNLIVDYCTFVRICYRSHIVDDLLGVYWKGIMLLKRRLQSYG